MGFDRNQKYLAFFRLPRVEIWKHHTLLKRQFL